MKRPKHLRYRSEAHAQIENGPIVNEADADERDAKAIGNLLRVVFSNKPKHPKRKRTKRKP